MGTLGVFIDPQAMERALAIGERSGLELQGSARRITDCCSAISVPTDPGDRCRRIGEGVVLRSVQLRFIKDIALALEASPIPTGPGLLGFGPFDRIANGWVSQLLSELGLDPDPAIVAFLLRSATPSPLTLGPLAGPSALLGAGTSDRLAALIAFFRRQPGPNALTGAVKQLMSSQGDMLFTARHALYAFFSADAEIRHRVLSMFGFVGPDKPFQSNGNLAVGVAGMGSSYINPDKAPFGLPFGKLGYANQDVHYLSYRPGSSRYSAMDTYQDIEISAQAFDQQLRDLKRANPGRAVDLYAHSLGGFVITYWLQKYYKPGDPAYPEIQHLFTFASPLQGAPMAALDQRLDNAPATEASIRKLLGSQGTALPPDRSPFAKQVAPGSDITKFINETPLPKGVKVLHYAAATDAVVPASRAGRSGAHVRIQDPKGNPFEEHSSLVTDPATIRDVQRDLMGQRRTYRGLLVETERSIRPTAVAGAEDGIANVLVGSAPR